MKDLEIENERFKKGYQVKGVGANKVFVSLKDVSTKQYIHISADLVAMIANKILLMKKL